MSISLTIQTERLGVREIGPDIYQSRIEGPDIIEYNLVWTASIFVDSIISNNALAQCYLYQKIIYCYFMTFIDI